MVDLIAAMVVGSATDLQISWSALAAEEFRGSEAVLAFPRLRATAPGSALVNGMINDAMDSLDGHRPGTGSPWILSQVDSMESAGDESELVLQLAAVPSEGIEGGETEAL